MIQHGTLDHIVDALNGAMLDDARWADTSALIDECFRTEGNVLTFGEDLSSGGVEIFFSKWYFRGVDRPAWQRDYFLNYYAEDEHLPRMRALPDAKIVPIDQLFSELELKTSRMYNEAMACFGAQKGLTTRLDGPGGSRIVWEIANPIDASGWSASQIDLIARVLPHLRQYVRVRSALVDAGALGMSADELLGNARIGVIQLDLRGRIVEANDSATELLRRDDGLTHRDGALRAARPADSDRLQALMAQALPRFGVQGSSGSMIVRRSLLPSLALHVRPVANRESDYRARHVAALVLTVDPVDQARVDPSLAEAALGLTPTETEIALLLAQGRTPRQIAVATGRGYSTVRTHLKHMFAKLGVSRQFEVVQLVLALSRLPAFRD